MGLNVALNRAQSSSAYTTPLGDRGGITGRAERDGDQIAKMADHQLPRLWRLRSRVLHQCTCVLRQKAQGAGAARYRSQNGAVDVGNKGRERSARKP